MRERVIGLYLFIWEYRLPFYGSNYLSRKRFVWLKIKAQETIKLRKEENI
jgi:hypothetical protein